MIKLLALLVWLAYIVAMAGFTWFILDSINIGLNPATLGFGGFLVIAWFISGVCVYGLTESVFEEGNNV